MEFSMKFSNQGEEIVKLKFCHVKKRKPFLLLKNNGSTSLKKKKQELNAVQTEKEFYYF